MTTGLTTDFSRTGVDLLVITVDKCANTYSVAPCTASLSAGKECRNSFHTCQDRANYVRTTEEWPICTKGIIPFKGSAIYEPILDSLNISATELKEQAKKPIKSRLKFKLMNYRADNIASELMAPGDPYADTRASFQGTRLRKLLARHPNLKGRPIKYLRGALGDSLGEYIQIFQGVIYDVSQDVNGDVTIEAEDLLAKMEETFIPPKVQLKIVEAITDSDVTLTVDSPALLPSAPNYVYIGEELIKYGAKDDITGVLSTLSRGQEGTTAASHSDNSKVVRVQWWDFDNPFDILEDILDIVGYTAGQIDSATFASEKIFPETDINFSAFITEPTKASDLYYEIVDHIDADSWVGEDLKITIRRRIQNRPGRTYTDFTEDASFILDTQAVDRNQKNIITRATMLWDLRVGQKMDEIESYERVNQFINTDAESVNDRDEAVEDVLRSRFIRNGDISEEELQSYVGKLLRRRVRRKQLERPILKGDFEIKDFQIKTGDWARLTTERLEDRDGNPFTDARFQAIMRTDKGSKIGVKFIKVSDIVIGFWAPDTLVNDFENATDPEKEYGFWAEEASERIPDGSELGADPYTYW